jgi:hypothetical protein
MRKEVYSFLVLSAVCAAVEWFGNFSGVVQFSYGQALVVAMCFATAAFFTVYNAVNALPYES